ncbi:MAG: hypothetical protein MJY66_09080 [Bacteroidaceae bacterium]|nr:hypothetical protein [Bacteroidaceae bacterium]
MAAVLAQQKYSQIFTVVYSNSGVRKYMKKALTFARKCLIFRVGHLGLDCETDEGLVPE